MIMANLECLPCTRHSAKVLSSPGLTQCSPQPFLFTAHQVGGGAMNGISLLPDPRQRTLAGSGSTAASQCLAPAGSALAGIDSSLLCLESQYPTAQLGVKSDAEEFTAAPSVSSHPSSRPFTSCFSRCAPVYFVPLFLRLQVDFVELGGGGLLSERLLNP